jgi:hypothetical protein
MWLITRRLRDDGPGSGAGLGQPKAAIPWRLSSLNFLLDGEGVFEFFHALFQVFNFPFPCCQEQVFNPLKFGRRLGAQNGQVFLRGRLISGEKYNSQAARNLLR